MTAKELLEEFCKNYCHEEGKCDWPLCNIPQAIALLPRWIRVGDRLPKHDYDVLVLHTTICAIGGYENGQWYVDGLTAQCVTHWMEIPELPKEVK